MNLMRSHIAMIESGVKMRVDFLKKNLFTLVTDSTTFPSRKSSQSCVYV